MSKICPIINSPVLYLDCLECEDRGKCNDKTEYEDNVTEKTDE